MSRPKLCAVVAWRLNSVQRSSLLASRRQPVCRQPVASPVSSSSLLVEIDGVAQHLGDRGGRAQLADEPRRVPGRAAGQPALLDQDDIGLVVAGQMIGGRAADDAAADDDDLGTIRQRRTHASGLPALIRLMRSGEPVHVVDGVGGIVEIELRVDFRHHAPHRLAQQRRALHGAIALHQTVVG